MDKHTPESPISSPRRDEDEQKTPSPSSAHQEGRASASKARLKDDRPGEEFPSVSDPRAAMTFQAPSAPPANRKSPPQASPSAYQPIPATPASNAAVFSIGSNYGKASRGSTKKVSPRALSLNPGGLTTPGLTPTSKASRGLRHFSVQVCRFVESRGKTTYNEVADNLVHQVIQQRRQEDPNAKCDEKNIRRRVYDALNVLLAMEIICKDKKEIIWRGLPDGPGGGTPPPAPVFEEELDDYDSQEYDELMRERDYRRAEIERKRDALREVLVQQVCFRNLVMHNQSREYPVGGHHSPPPEDEKIPLPFIISNTKPSAVVQCDMNAAKDSVMFEFDSPFEINDDNTILKRMDMDKTTMPVLQGMLPEDMLHYCHHSRLLEDVLLPDDEEPIAAQAPSSVPHVGYGTSQHYVL